MILISHDNAPIGGNPAEGPLDCISSLVAIPQSVILSVDVAMVLSVRDKKIDSSLPQPFAGRIAVVGLVSDYSLRSGPWSSGSSFGDSDLSKSFIKERDLSRRGTVSVASESPTYALNPVKVW